MLLLDDGGPSNNAYHILLALAVALFVFCALHGKRTAGLSRMIARGRTKDVAPVVILSALLLLLLLLLLYRGRVDNNKEFFDSRTSAPRPTTTTRIPRTILQNTKDEPVPGYAVDKIMALAPGWSYVCFTDAQTVEYLTRYKDGGGEGGEREFPDILEKYQAISRGAHKSDLFRYFYLYLNGGVFIDSDAMITCPLDDVAQDFELFTGNTPGESRIFNGFLGTTPKNPAIRQLLAEAYATDPHDLRSNYFLYCQQGYSVLSKMMNETPSPAVSIKMYDERFTDNGTASTFGDDGVSVILIHYYASKVIPRDV